MIKKIHSEKAPKAIGPYSQAIIFNGMVFTSGQIPINPETGLVAGEDIRSQTVQVMDNLKAVLEEAGTTLEHVIKTTCYLDDMEDFSVFNEEYGKYFTSQPARSCVAVQTLPKQVLCEVEVIATLN